MNFQYVFVYTLNIPQICFDYSVITWLLKKYISHLSLTVVIGAVRDKKT